LGETSLKKYISKKIIFNTIVLVLLSFFLVGPTLTLGSVSPPHLHTYDFENETMGQNPTYETFTINEAAGNVYVDDLIDVQQKHMVLQKINTSGRVFVNDYFSLAGETYVSGEYHVKVYHDNSGFGINLNSEGGQYILALVWWNGEIRDDVGGTFLANYTLNQWIEVVIYFDLNLGWMFDLDGVRHGHGYSLPFYGSFTGNADHIWMTSFVSGGGNGYFRVDDISAYGRVDDFIFIIIIIIVVIAIVAVVSVALILFIRKKRK
jgi:hypothetical protein